jgi:hypothetical protein
MYNRQTLSIYIIQEENTHSKILICKLSDSSEVDTIRVQLTNLSFA